MTLPVGIRQFDFLDFGVNGVNSKREYFCFLSLVALYYFQSFTLFCNINTKELRLYV